VAIMLENYHNGSFCHMTTTIGAYSWHGALILESARSNDVSGSWVPLSGVTWHRRGNGGSEPLGHALG
jgi:hypothetical protein